MWFGSCPGNLKSGDGLSSCLGGREKAGCCYTIMDLHSQSFCDNKCANVSCCPVRALCVNLRVHRRLSWIFSIGIMGGTMRLEQK